MNKKRAILIFSLVFLSSILGISMVNGIRIEPPEKPPPPPPPPPSQTISGYVKESGTNIGIEDARVVLFGWAFVIDMYQQVQVGVRNTDSNGFYSFTDVTADAPYKLLVTKSGYNGYSGSYAYTVYLSTPYCSLRVTGTVLEDGTIDNIKSPGSVDLMLDIKPDENMVYNYVITSTPVYIDIFTGSGSPVKVGVPVSTIDGSFDTGTFTILKGTVIIKAYTYTDPYTTECYYYKIIERSVTASTTLTGIDFILERKQGLVSAYSDEQIREEMLNFYVKLFNCQSLENLRFNLESRCTPQIVYYPLYSGAKYNYLETSYEFTTWDFWVSFFHYYYCPRYITQYLYVYNHWTGDESIIALDDLDFGITQEGSYPKFQWTLGAKVGFKGSDSLPISAEFSVSATYTPPNYILYDTSWPNQDLTDGRYLGYLSFDYTNTVFTVLNTMSSVWYLKVDNSLMKSVKQGGAHLTFKIITDVNYWLCMDFFGTNMWHTDACKLRFEQTLGDGDPYGVGDNSPPPHPTVTLLSGSYDELQYGEMHGYDLWMNLLAGEIEPPL